MAVLLQVARRPRRGLGRARRCGPPGSARRSSCCRACIVLVTHDTIGWVTIVLVWLGHVTVTGAELFQSAGHWGYLSELSDPDRLGEYQGAAHLGGTLGAVWAPAAYTFLAIEWGSAGLAGDRRRSSSLATLGMGPSARAAERSPGTRRPPRRACLNPRSWRPRRSGWPGARPRTLPAAVAPVLAGTGVAAYVGDARVVEGAAGARGEPGAPGRRQLRQRLLRRRSAAPTTTGSGRCGWSARGWPRRRAVKRAAFLAFARGRGRRSRAGGHHRVVAGGGRRRLRRRRLVLHRRLEALRLPRARRGDGVRVLRAGRRGRHDLRADRALVVGRRSPPASASGALACAILVVNNLRDIPTDRVAGKRTLAVRLGEPRTRVLYVAARGRRGRWRWWPSAALTSWWALLGLGFLAVAAPAVRTVLERRRRAATSCPCCRRPAWPSSSGPCSWPARCSS